MSPEVFVLAVMNGQFFRDCIAGSHTSCSGTEHAGHDCHISRVERTVTVVSLNARGEIEGVKERVIQAYYPCCRRMVKTP